MRIFVLLALIGGLAHATDLPLRLYAVGELPPAKFRQELRRPLAPGDADAQGAVTILRKDIESERVFLDLKANLPLPAAILDQIGVVHVSITDKTPKRKKSAAPQLYDLSAKTQQGTLRASLSMDKYRKGSLAKVDILESTLPPWFFDFVLYAALSSKAVLRQPPPR